MGKLFIGMLAVALFIVLAIPAYAQDKEGDKPSREEMARVKERIWKAVEEGTITEEQAQERWEAYLKRVRGGEREEAKKPTREEMAKVKEEIWKGVKEGTITEEQAKERWEGYLKKVRGGEKKEGPCDWIPGVLHEKGELTREQIEKVMEVIPRIMGEMKQHDEKLRKKIIEEFDTDGDGEISAEERKAIPDDWSDDKKFELNRETEQYLAQDIGLTDEQIKLVLGCAQRALYSMEKDKVDWDSMNKRIMEAVKRGDLTEEEARKKLEEIRRRRAEEKGERGEKKKVDWDSMNKRIMAAVERGDLTEEEARKKLQEIRRRMAEEEGERKSQ